MEEYLIDEEWEGARLDRFVQHLRPDLSFPSINILLRKGRIKLNGKKAKGSRRLRPGEIVTISISDELQVERANRRRSNTASSSPPITDKKLSILYEDDEILVIDKPRGIPVHPGNRRERGSLLDMLEEHRGSTETQKSESSGRFPLTPVHRLDFETTGVLVVAKTRRAARELARSFREGLIEKTYLAILDGMPDKRKGTISKPLIIEKGKRSSAKTVDSPEAEAESTNRKSAETHYRVIRKLSARRVLVEIRIHSGRTHQIRAHMASIGTPILGDTKYGRLAKSEKSTRGKLCLHAWKISFPHPSDGRRMEVTCEPDWLTGID